MFKVLIVEDDPMVMMINEQYVTRHKDLTVVGKCGDGAEALRFLETRGADLVILDVFLPRMTGIEVLRALREKKIPASVIMVTAANDPTTFEAAMALGAVDYLVKPFAYERFRAALDRFVSKIDLIQGRDKLDQSRIDRILGGDAPKKDLPKGIQEQTRDLILECLAEKDGWMTGEEIAERTGVSSVTVRRYLNHLVQTGELISRINYETGGRPSQMVRLPG